MWKDDIKENKRAMAKLQAGAETCKHVLTSHGTATCSVESLHEGIDFQCNVSRYVIGKFNINIPWGGVK